MNQKIEIHPIIAEIGQAIAADFCQTDELGRQIAAAIERRTNYSALVKALEEIDKRALNLARGE